MFLKNNMTSSIWLMTQGTDNVSVRVQSLSTSSSPFDQQVTVSPGQAVTFHISLLFEQPLGNVVTNDGVRITAPSPIFVDVYLQSVSNGDFHSLIPDPLLGTEYVAASYKKIVTKTASFILVVAQAATPTSRWSSANWLTERPSRSGASRTTAETPCA